MKSSELIITVANLTGAPREVVKEVLTTAGEVVADVLSQPGEELVIVPGFGRFAPRDRLPRLGRNPRTGDEVSIRGKRVAKFAANKTFRDTVARR
jgi:nucleoid DNA-binding protein